MNFLTKKSVFVLLILSAAVFSITQWYLFDYLCTTNGQYDNACGDILFNIKMFALSLGTLLIPSLITFPFRPAVFNAWKWFGVFAIPVVIALTFYIGNMSDGGGFGVAGFAPGLILLPVLYGLFVLISLVIIIVTAIRTRKHV